MVEGPQNRMVVSSSSAKDESFDSINLRWSSSVLVNNLSKVKPHALYLRIERCARSNSSSEISTVTVIEGLLLGFDEEAEQGGGVRLAVAQLRRFRAAS